MYFFRHIAYVTTFIIFSISTAFAVPSGVFSDKYAAIVIDANTGKTLFEEKADLRRYPASLTKIMTLYMLFEAMQSGKVSRNTVIRVSSHAASRPPTKMGLRAGQGITADVAARSLIVKSANDVAAAIGEHLGGTEKEFARIMTMKARKLGMMHTNFANASGLPDVSNYSTARDMAILSLAIREHFPQYYQLFNSTSFTFRGRRIEGHNRLVKSMQGVDGIKTGYTHMSGFNLASSRRLGGRRVVAVVMGGKTAGSRDSHMSQLLSRYMQKASGQRSSAVLIASRENISSSDKKVIPVPELKESQITNIADNNKGVSSVSAESGSPVLLTFFDKKSVGKRVPVPSFKVIAKNQENKSIEQQVADISDREHDSALLMALTNQDFNPPSAAAAAADEVVVNKMPMVQKAAGNVNSVSGSKKISEIQIGSLANRNEANQLLSRASKVVRIVSRDAEPYVQPFEKGSSHYYRARFRGFLSKKEALDTCSRLKRMHFNCYVAEG